MKKTLLIALSVSMLFIAGCKKDTQEPPKEPEKKEYKVYTTGVIYNSTVGPILPCYWINERQIFLETGNTQEAFSYGIDKHNDDIYVGGGYFGVHPDAGAILMPCYWKNGSKINLPVTGLPIVSRCGVSDVRWFNDALYLLGDADMQPVIWKVKNSQVSIIRVPAGMPVQDLRKTSNLEVFNNRLYIGGNRRYVESGVEYFDAGYWTIDAADNIQYQPVEQKLLQALCFSITVNAAGVYLVGEYQKNSGSLSQPALWTPQGHSSSESKFNLSVHRVGQCAVDKNNQLYLNVLDIQLHQPIAWKIHTDGNVTDFKPAVPAGAEGFCNGVTLADNQPVYLWSYQLNKQYFPYYYFEGKEVRLENDIQKYVSLHRIRVFEQ